METCNEVFSIGDILFWFLMGAVTVVAFSAWVEWRAWRKMQEARKRNGGNHDVE